MPVGGFEGWVHSYRGSKFAGVPISTDYPYSLVSAFPVVNFPNSKKEIDFVFFKISLFFITFWTPFEAPYNLFRTENVYMPILLSTVHCQWQICITLFHPKSASAVLSTRPAVSPTIFLFGSLEAISVDFLFSPIFHALHYPLHASWRKQNVCYWSKNFFNMAESLETKTLPESKLNYECSDINIASFVRRRTRVSRDSCGKPWGKISFMTWNTRFLIFKIRSLRVDFGGKNSVLVEHIFSIFFIAIRVWGDICNII